MNKDTALNSILSETNSLFLKVASVFQATPLQDVIDLFIQETRLEYSFLTLRNLRSALGILQTLVGDENATFHLFFINHRKIAEEWFNNDELSTHTRRSTFQCWCMFMNWVEFRSYRYIRSELPSLPKELRLNRTPGPRPYKGDIWAILENIRGRQIRDYLMIRLVMLRGYTMDYISRMSKAMLPEVRKIFSLDADLYFWDAYISGQNQAQEQSEFIFSTRRGKKVMRTHCRMQIDRAAKHTGQPSPTLAQLKNISNAFLHAEPV